MIATIIQDRLENDGVLTGLLTSLPNDNRASAVITDGPLTKEDHEDFFIGGQNVPYPTVDIHGGVGPIDHPNNSAWRTLTASYPTITVYAPTLAGINGTQIVTSVMLRIRALLDGWRTSDDGRWVRIEWFGEDRGIRPSVDFPSDTVQGMATYEATQPWTLED